MIVIVIISPVISVAYYDALLHLTAHAHGVYAGRASELVVLNIDNSFLVRCRLLVKIVRTYILPIQSGLVTAYIVRGSNHALKAVTEINC